MPCRDYMENDCSSYQNDARILKQKLDNVTRLLCTVMTYLDNVDSYFVLDEVLGLRSWWEEHKENDKKRVIDDLKNSFDENEIAIIKEYLNE